MKYIVMECHLSYAILLDENGRFIKAANLHYETGQTVTDIIDQSSFQYYFSGCHCLPHFCNYILY